MTLATRCLNCGTAFKVSQDQLKVSSGWVRCGRCQATFNALETLFEAAPAPTSPAAVPQMVEEPDPSVEAQTAAPAVSLDLRAPVEPVREWMNDPPAVSTTPASAHFTAYSPQSPEPNAPPFDGIQAESVLSAVPFTSAERRGSRWMQVAGVVALGVMLAIQGLLLARDVVAAHWPASQDLLLQACDLIGCRVEALRQSSELTVESSELRKLAQGPVYRLGVTVRNRGNTPVMTPAFDLTLTDSQGAIVARRVIRAVELGSSQATLGARAEMSLQAYLAASEAGVTGYTIEAFYP